ncbi:MULTISPECIES: fimbrial assembly protein [Bhargavaea]|uniref:Fimbrial assembly protein n=1 Tax=Bhargavaea changchunensis TaxID=2134037 RepID=A0ABW2NEY3_9BACL|nr:fimbrial assembly protein [Bhargavaea sp. CC-171006]
MLVDINLLPERERGASKALLVSLTFIAAALLFWLTLFIMADRNADEAVRLNSQSEQIRNRQEELRSVMTGTDTMAERQQLEATVGWAESYRYPTAPLLRQLVSYLPLRGFIMDYTYTGPHTAELEIQFDRYEQAAHYLARLKAAEIIDNAAMTEVTAEPLEEEEHEEGNPVNPDETLVPRYRAVYTIEFVDTRDDAEGTAVGEEPLEGEEEEAPAEEEETDVNVDVNQNVEQNVDQNVEQNVEQDSDANTETGSDPAGEQPEDGTAEGGDGQ